VVALVPVAGPVPPPTQEVIPLAMASGACCGLMKWMLRVDSARRQDQALSGDRLGGDTHHQPRRHARHGVGVSRLADPGDASVLDADVRFVDPGPVQDERVGDHAVQRLRVGGAGLLSLAVAQHLAAAELALVAVGGEVPLHLRDQRGVPQPHAVAGGGAVEVRIVAAIDAPAHDLAPAPANGTSCTVLLSPGSKRTAVPAGMSRCFPCARPRSKASARFVSEKG